ncbi:MAG: DMT family transporter, partial [SAR324 cluster bacterium]|nr:DMT family transporter [SAR324 cluster bacterium]
MRDSPLLPWILMTGIAFGWGLNWEILKTGVEEIPPWVFRGASSLPAGLILLVIAKLGKQSLRIERRDWMALFVASLLNMMLWGVLILYGLTQMTGGRAAVLAFTMPVWAALSDSMFSRKLPSRRLSLALLIGTGGVLLLWTGDPETRALSIWGPLMVILGGACWGLGTSFVKRRGFPVSPLVLTGWMQVLGTIPILLVAVIWDWENIGSPGMAQYFSLAYNILVAGSLIYWAYFAVVQRLSVMVSTISTLAVPLIAVLADAVMEASWPGWS